MLSGLNNIIYKNMNPKMFSGLKNIIFNVRNAIFSAIPKKETGLFKLGENVKGTHDIHVGLVSTGHSPSNGERLATSHY